MRQERLHHGIGVLHNIVTEKLGEGHGGRVRERGVEGGQRERREGNEGHGGGRQWREKIEEVEGKS